MGSFSSLVLLPLMSFLLLQCYASAQHTLGTGSSLSVEDHARPFLVSPDATFSCGFLQAGDNAFYFSIWFTATKNKTAVWSANPGAPVNGRLSRVSFSRDGELALADANGTTVWDTKTGGNRQLTVSLNDTGNLVITDPSTGHALWQSFHWPTDTLLPSQAMSKDTKLVAGYYTFYYDNDNVLRLLYDGPEIASIYWPDPDLGIWGSGRTNYNSSRFGILNDAGAFRSSDGLRFQASDLGSPGVKRRLTIDKDGNLRLYSLVNATGVWTVTWVALQKPCSVHGLCGKNALCEYQPSLRCSCAPGYEMADRRDWRKGCKPTFSLPAYTAINCSQGVPEEYTFVKVAYTDFYGYDLAFNKSVTFESCMNICLQMCSCTAFSYRMDGVGNCFPKGVLFNGYTSSFFPGSIYLKVPSKVNASALPLVAAKGLACKPNGTSPAIVPGYADTYGRPGSGPKWAYFFSFAAVLGFLELLIFAAGWWFLSSHHSIPSSLQAGYRLVMATQFRRFSYQELKNATGNFKEELGRGGSGVVYRGVLDEGTVVAVKKLTDVQVQGEEDFWAEVAVFGRINHINLVRIWGFCSEGKHRMLVYEYVENESLDRHLFGTHIIGRSLSWAERFRVALGAARGLAYLHHECLEWVIHCDVKPENILLTRDLDAKIADFGLAKLSGRDAAASDGVQLSHMRGTTGYMAPEWALGQPVDAKVDVYSYGIVLLEIVIGTRISDQTTADGEERLEMGQIAQALKQVVASGDIGSLVDTRLNGQFHPRQAMEMVKISLSCMEERSSRPTMDDISKALTACDDEDEHPAYVS
ncbi:putative receptor protein kinase ZmPK1 [Lolium rigidum]|uniref:putative receptor protein kinase ZmPK1 n=1 Tax=Lolium rigidum TaxID=89674 RepID=UPI001F5CE35E|nr:putative receptor protein kinase ZmPK1 [Lolium rigidum]